MIKKYLAALLLTLPCLALLSVVSAPTANAVDGCTSKVQLRADSWSENVGYWGPDFPSIRPNFFVIRLTATTGYWVCPNGSLPTKVKPLWTDFCWSHIKPTHGSDNFTGATFNPYYYDDNTITNPPGTKVDDDSSVQNCKKYNIPTSDEKWLSITQHARWNVVAWVNKFSFPDTEREFDWNGNNWKPFQPDDDVSLGPWHW